MGKRSTGRKLAMQVLYQSELRNSSPDQLLPSFWEVHHFETETKTWAETLAVNTWKFHQELDELIQKFAIGWDLSRINPIDKSVLRMALYEIIHDGVDASIVINEAVEICKKYASDDSPRFVNGILGQYVKQCSLES